MSRRAAREIAMKLLYQLEIQKDDREAQINAVLDENSFMENDRKYLLDVVEGVHAQKMFLDELIEKHAKGWKLNRISKVDLSILRLSIYEISFRQDIPFTVSINEAVELAKKYSGEEAGAFVNGVLSKIPGVRVPVTEDPVGQTDNE